MTLVIVAMCHKSEYQALLTFMLAAPNADTLRTDKLLP